MSNANPTRGATGSDPDPAHPSARHPAADLERIADDQPDTVALLTGLALGREEQ